MRKILKLENTLERAFVTHTQLLGFHAIKIQMRGWPDRLILLSNGYCFYIEFKRLGFEAGDLQKHIHKQLRAMGIHVYVVDNMTRAKLILDYEIRKSYSRPFKELR